jgi:hypothetical protein
MPLVELLAQFCGYEFGEDDADAIAYGIKETEHEDNKWFEYSIQGRSDAGLRLSKDTGTAVVHFEIDSTREIENKMEVALTVLNHLRTRA